MQPDLTEIKKIANSQDSRYFQSLATHKLEQFHKSFDFYSVQTKTKKNKPKPYKQKKIHQTKPDQKQPNQTGFNLVS